MYGIRIKDYIIREISRQIDREQNQLFITMLVDIMYGSEWSGENASMRRSFGFSISKENNNGLWKILKDCNNREVMEYVYQIIGKTIETYSAYKTWESNPEYGTTVQGEAQAAVSVPKPNPYIEILDELKVSIFCNDTSLLDHLIKIGDRKTLFEFIELG